MQLVLLDTRSVRCARDRCNFSFDEILLCANHVKCVDNDPEAKKSILEILADHENNSWLKVDLTYKVSGSFEVHLKCASKAYNIFRKLRDHFHDHVRISVNLEAIVNDGDGGDFRQALLLSEEMPIHSENYTCSSGTLWLNEDQLDRVIRNGSAMAMAIHAHIYYDDFSSHNVNPGNNSPPPEIPPLARKNKRILEEGLASDIVITAGNGKEIKCHKCFLLACSSVFQTMFQSGMEESKTGRLDMSDISEEGICAFLRHLYYDDLTMPQESVEIAYELFYIAHKYDIPSLEASMAKRLVQEKDEEFMAELAFRIYMFVRGIHSAGELKSKIVHILAMKVEELEKMTEYKELFKKTPDAAMELCKYFAKASSKLNTVDESFSMD